MCFPVVIWQVVRTKYFTLNAGQMEGVTNEAHGESVIAHNTSNISQQSRTTSQPPSNVPLTTEINPYQEGTQNCDALQTPRSSRADDDSRAADSLIQVHRRSDEEQIESQLHQVDAASTPIVQPVPSNNSPVNSTAPLVEEIPAVEDTRATSAPSRSKWKRYFKVNRVSRIIPFRDRAKGVVMWSINRLKGRISSQNVLPV